MRKSTCCRAKIRRFSGRRRQCGTCGRTWSVRPRRRGRKALRTDDRLVQRVLIDQRSLTQIAKSRGLSRQALSHRFRRVLQSRFHLSRIESAHDEDLILLADGLWFKFRGRPWVLYLMALRPVSADQASFLDPILLEGPESKHAWKRAFASVASNRLIRVCALVGDKFKGCRSIAEENGWALQLCHYHLIAQLERSQGKRRLNLKARTLRREAYRLVQKALLTSDWKELGWIVFCLKAIVAEPVLPTAYKRVVKGFLRHMDHYHTYLAYPNLRLPTTNNSSEAMGRRVRDLMGRTRSLSSPTSLRLWATEYIRRKPVIACRPG
jgi:hypothetical protein